MIAENSAWRFVGSWRITCTLMCKTGLHIGGSQDVYEIGAENAVVKDPVTKQPYIPGSSLKGKLRSLVELSEGDVKCWSKGAGKRCGECNVCSVFGSPAGSSNANQGPTRLLVRDAFPCDVVSTEIKFENTIDRKSGKATPRQMERVPAGSKFSVEFVYRVFSKNGESVSKDELEGLERLFNALLLLQEDYLGGGGSRGSGRVGINLTGVSWRAATGKVTSENDVGSSEVELTIENGIEECKKLAAKYIDGEQHR